MTSYTTYNTKIKRQIKAFIVLIFFAMLILGCATTNTVRVPHMIPELATSDLPVSDRILILAEVKGGEKSDPSNPYEIRIDNEDFKEAVLKTLEKANIFSRIVENQDGDYELYVEILSQQSRVTGGLFSTKTSTSRLLVNYKLIDKKSNQEVWEDHFFSEFSAEDDSSVEAVPKAVQKAKEGAARDSLNQMVTKLSMALDKMIEK